MAKSKPNHQTTIERLRKEIAIGNQQADRAEFVDGGAVFAKIQQRSAQRKRAQGRKTTRY